MSRLRDSRALDGAGSQVGRTGSGLLDLAGMTVRQCEDGLGVILLLFMAPHQR